MPTVNVKKDLLFEAIGQKYSDDEFQSLCFAYGLEIDEVTSEKQVITKEQSDVAGLKDILDEIIYKIDIPANRYDLLCLEGLTIALKVFLGLMTPPRISIMNPSAENLQTLKIMPDTGKIRPFAVGAVLRNVTFSQESYDSFIDLQDKLHLNLCRKRSLVAIGTHDLDTIQTPFVYDAKPPKEIRFVPLNQTKEMDAVELMEFFSNHTQLKQYLPIIRDSDVYPVITDANGVVLSMPPVINGDHSKISLKTKNVFIECTATDLTKAKIVLDTLVSMFSVYCTEKFSVESCNVILPDGTSVNYPELAYREEKISPKNANAYVGVEQSAEELAKMLCKMCLETVVDENDELLVQIPPTRHDVIHACDIYEDIAIAYGYNNIKKSLPSLMHIAKQFPLNQLTELLRENVAQAGFTEALTFTLCSKDDLYNKFNKNFDKASSVQIMNPKTLEFQVVRTTLIPGLLKTIAANKKMPLPLKLFEISDVVVVDNEAEVGTRNERRFCAINCNKNAGFEVVHGLLDRIMKILEIGWRKEDGYYLREYEDAAYFPGRCANVVYKDVVLGKIGVLHPTVLHAFELTHPCSVVELNIEPFV